MNIGQRVTYRDDFFSKDRLEGTVTEAGEGHMAFVRWDRHGETIPNPAGGQVVQSKWIHENQLTRIEE